jgi:hypothetical protein
MDNLSTHSPAARDDPRVHLPIKLHAGAME